MLVCHLKGGKGNDLIMLTSGISLKIIPNQSNSNCRKDFWWKVVKVKWQQRGKNNMTRQDALCKVVCTTSLVSFYVDINLENSVMLFKLNDGKV